MQCTYRPLKELHSKAYKYDGFYLVFGESSEVASIEVTR